MCRTSRSRFRKRGGGQTKDQNQIKDTLHKLSVHRVFVPSRLWLYVDNTSPVAPGTRVIFTHSAIRFPKASLVRGLNLIQPHFAIKCVRISIFQRNSWLCPYHNWVHGRNDRARCTSPGRLSRFRNGCRPNPVFPRAGNWDAKSPFVVPARRDHSSQPLSGHGDCETALGHGRRKNAGMSRFSNCGSLAVWSALCCPSPRREDRTSCSTGWLGKSRAYSSSNGSS